MEQILATISQLFTVSGSRRQNELLYFAECPKEHLVGLLTHLRDHEGFTHLTFVTAVDRIEDGRFQVVYMLHNYDSGMQLGIEVYIGRDAPELDSIHTLWEQARVFQQELREMFGIRFPGSPRLDENFALEGWDGIPPMRRDFDTKKYSEETFFPRPGRFSEEPREYMKKKLYPDRGSDV
jgi:NADH-quinone oxidoreductase subunit C